jgi:hypothetical protein
MPILIFIMMYITGTMLSFAADSNFPGIGINRMLQALMFMKLKRKKIFIHALIFQAMNFILFSIFVAFYFLVNEKTIAAVYNIYMGASLALFIIIILITMIDAIVLEKNGKGRNR